jgi:hypothetical protein
MLKLKLVPILSFIASLAMLAGLSACGGGSKSGGSASPLETPGPGIIVEEDEMDLEGSYLAVLSPLNESLAGKIVGNVNLKRDGETLLAYARFSGGRPNSLPQIKLHAGTSCPGSAQDENADGLIDAVEAFEHAGGVLVPLDADLASQSRGDSIWTPTDEFGNYWYEESTAYARFISDLRAPQLERQSDYVKLGPDAPLNLSGRVVIVYGTSRAVELPETVRRRGRLANWQTLPVACGVMKKIKETPGILETDPEITLPGADGAVTVPGHGHDDGATLPINGEPGPAPATPEDEEDDERWPWERRPRN